MAKLSKKLAGDIGQAIYEVACAGNEERMLSQIIGGISDALDANGVDPEEFERAAGWDDEDRDKHRLRRMARLRGEKPQCPGYVRRGGSFAIVRCALPTSHDGRCAEAGQ